MSILECDWLRSQSPEADVVKTWWSFLTFISLYSLDGGIKKHQKMEINFFFRFRLLCINRGRPQQKMLLYLLLLYLEEICLKLIDALGQ